LVGGILNDNSIIQESMLAEKYNQGKTTIAPEVLLTIVQLTTLDVEGVSQMSNVPGAVNRFLKRDHGEGVRINIEDDIVNVDLYIILENNVNIKETGLSVQKAVERAINKMVGMKAGRINIHVEDIYFPEDATIE
jgi:uncharacterized alkaline shock family protein YloU